MGFSSEYQALYSRTITNYRSKVIEITWHNREGGKNDMIMSCEFHKDGILVTGGADNEVKVWQNAYLRNLIKL